MPSEETIQLMKMRNTLGETTDKPQLNTRSSLSSLIRSITTKIFGNPQLIHLYGTYRPNKTLNTAITKLTCFSSDGIYLYAGYNNSPGQILKIELSSFTIVSTMTLDAGEDYVLSLATDGTFLYATLMTSPGKVVKIRLSTFTKVSTLTLDAGENLPYSSFSDGTYLHLGLDTAPAMITKIDLATFTKVSTLTLDAGENYALSMFSDGIYLYIGTYTLPGMIIKVDIKTYTKIANLTFEAGEIRVVSVFSDGIYLYAGLLMGASSKIIKIDLATFTVINTLQLAFTDSAIHAIFTDDKYLYAASGSSPGKLIIIDLSTFTRLNSISFATGENINQTLFSDGTYVYSGTYNGKILRYYIIPVSDQYQRKISLIDEQTHTGTYYVYPTLAVGTPLQSAAAPWTKGVYTEVLPVNTVLTQYYITGIYVYNMTNNAEYEIDIATGLAGAEIVIASIFHRTDNIELSQFITLPVPIKISSKTRISARCADEVSSLRCRVKIQYKT